MNEKAVYEVLKNLSIEFEEYRHPPVFTVEEAEIHWKNINATYCKNLFFRDKKGKRHFLVIIRHDKQLDIKRFWELIGTGRLSFGSEERLIKYLGLKPGSVSPFGLINNSGKEVEVFVDKSLEHVDQLAFHPNDNCLTITLTAADFKKYLNWTGNTYQFIEI
jgi:Ala-tRNA(Pro) deacylase